MFVIPKEKMSVVDPQRMDTLPPEGRDVGGDHELYWLRRDMDGDVTVVSADKVPAAKAALEKAEAQRADDLAKAAAAAAPVETKAITPAPKPTGQK